MLLIDLPQTLAKTSVPRAACLFLGLFVSPLAASAQIAPVGAGLLEQRLAAEDPAALAKAARELGDPARGAILFYQPYLTCTQCHASQDGGQQLGPVLANMGSLVTDVYLVESILQPSKEIKEGFSSVTVMTVDGLLVTGLLVEDRADALLLREPTPEGGLLTIAQDDIDQRNDQAPSIMPAGLANLLNSRQQFLDLVRYLMEIAAQGPARELELRPPPSTYAALPLPEYESHIDHAGMLADLGPENFRRGEEIYASLCVNCHGTHQQPGSLPTSRRFASEPFKNGSDPYSMYQTLTKGFGMMVAQTWMVPKQKYDVIYYIREAYLRDDNPSQYATLDPAYLATLPQGTQRGPEPVKFEPWANMDYGPTLMATYEIGDDGANFAYKGIAIRLDAGPGGVSRGRYWMLYDHDTLRMAAAWSGEGFIDWNGINFNGRHQVIPRLAGRVDLFNPIGPGWADPQDGSLTDPRLRGRDGRPYGPLPRRWAHYQGLYYAGEKALIAYRVGDTEVLELPGLEMRGETPVYTRTFDLGPRSGELILQVARHPGVQAQLSFAAGEGGAPQALAQLGPPAASTPGGEPAAAPLQFDGATYVEVSQAEAFDLTSRDFTVSARLKTNSGGTVFCKTAPEQSWVADGKSLFVRDGRLVFDIGWVGAVRSRESINDDQWHDVALVWRADSGDTRLFIDGRLSGKGLLKPRAPVAGHAVRLGYTAADFPREQSFFRGYLSDVRFYQRALSDQQVAGLGGADVPADDLVARWLGDAPCEGSQAPDESGHGHVAVISGRRAMDSNRLILAGLRGGPAGLAWRADDGALQLVIPAGPQPLRFTLWTATVGLDAAREPFLSLSADDAKIPPLETFTRGGPRRWTDEVKTRPIVAADDGPFAVDVLTYPSANPWLCRLRLTGFDFLPDGQQAAVCSWDGNVWLVSGIAEPAQELTWRRIASGLFQPLGLKVIDGQIYVGCRDQIVVLRDLNGDGETDFYQNFNNDHQVTDHFHEFAMGLQVDTQGNLYYAKGARHALPALVPHHGTLLRVSPDGLRTDILAKGFRAPNGVCVNPDGTFFLTDQEGHWTPKNRINWVPGLGRFYGNMWGYHELTDESDSAMEQPLCWITNAFDRSPAELLWVHSDAWGPLRGSLLNLSYGYGKVYVVPHEQVRGQMQGGMCELPIPLFPTGVMRGRFHPGNGQLYLCGMYSWAGNQQEPGGFFRLRYTGQPPRLPVGLTARRQGMAITFTDPLDPQTAGDFRNYAVKTWSLHRTANYGSDHLDEQPSPVVAAELAADGRTVLLKMPQIRPTWCMEIKYSLKSLSGQPVVGTIHNTVHYLSD